MPTGVVSEFDADRGLGRIVTDDGTQIGFHCTAIADGSRSIVGAVAVRFDRVPGRRGHWEAGAVEKLA